MIGPTAATLLVSECCNLSCSYCFEKNKKNIKMSNEIAEKATLMLFDNAKKSQNKNVGITFFGGEPFLNFDTIKHVTDLAIKLEESSKVHFNFDIITNGTIINKSIVEYLKDLNNTHPFSIQLSVDGVKKFHDYYRKDARGWGSFSTIESNIKMFKEIFGGEDFANNKANRGRLHIHSSMNKKTLRNLYDSWKYFYEVWKIPKIWHMAIHSERWSLEDVKIYDQQMTLISEELLKKAILNNDSTYISDYAPLNKCLERIIENNDKPCGAGFSFISVTADGSIYPCHQFYYQDEKFTKIGDVYKGLENSRREIFANYDASDMNCKKISCKNYTCYRCIAENYYSTGSILNCEISERCKMSSIDTRLQQKMKEVLILKGLIKND